MNETDLRAMRPDDWEPAHIPTGSYSNPAPLTGYQRRGIDVRRGNVLHPIHGDLGFEVNLAGALASLRARSPGLKVERHTVQMPFWSGHALPAEADYRFVGASRPLTTTSITLLLVPQAQVRDATLGYYYDHDHLPSLRERLSGRFFGGVAGNLGYYYTAALVGADPGTAKAWAHNVRYPHYPLPPRLSYIGFSLFLDPATGERCGTFHGAHPGAVGIRGDGRIEILPRLQIDGYRVTLAGRTFDVAAINEHSATGAEVALWTPALRTPEIEALTAATEASAGADDAWQRFAPLVPLADRVHVYVTNEGDGQRPVPQVAAVWEGTAPLPSCGGVLSFTHACFRRLYGSVAAFEQRYLDTPLLVVPYGATPFEAYSQMLGGLVPAVVDGKHVLYAESVEGVMAALSRTGNANSPLAQTGRETRNFDPYVREPAGLLVQAADQIGWLLFDGRHEASIGASVVDVALLLAKMQNEGLLPPVEQALFIDGGSAMKAYHVQADGRSVRLDVLNRVAAGSRNKPGADPDGLNLYTLLALSLMGR